MKICNFHQFCELPDGILFSYFEPEIATGLFVRGQVLEDLETGEPMDYFESSLLPYFDFGAEEIRLDPSPGRWGMFNKDQLYLVYEKDDLELLRRFTDQAIEKA